MTPFSEAQAELVKLHFGRWLRNARQKAKLTQAEAAKAIGYEVKQNIGNWENGVVPPPTYVFAKLVRLYGIDKKEALKRFEALKSLPVQRELGKLEGALG